MPGSCALGRRLIIIDGSMSVRAVSATCCVCRQCRAVALLWRIHLLAERRACYRSPLLLQLAADVRETIRKPAVPQASVG